MSETDSNRRRTDTERRRFAGSPMARLGLPAVVLGLVVLVFLVAPQVSPRSMRHETTSRLEWMSIEPPVSGVRRASLATTDTGFILLGPPGAAGTTIWTSGEGVDWEADVIDFDPLGVTVRDDELIVFRGYAGRTIRLEGGGWETGTEVVLPAFARSGYYSGRSAVVDLSGELFVHSVDGELYHRDGEGSFEQVVGIGEWWRPDTDLWARFTAPLRRNTCRPPFEASLDYPPLYETPGGYAAMIPLEIGGPNLTWPVCDPQVWHSADGSSWARPVVSSGFETGSYVYDVGAGPDGLFAVGGVGERRPALWTSKDGLEWTRLEWPRADEPFALSSISTGGAGLLIIGTNATGSADRAWYSKDGTCWTAVPSHVTPLSAAVGDSALVIADAHPDGPLWVAHPDGFVPSSCDVDTSGPPDR